MVAVTGFESVTDVRTAGKLAQIEWDALVRRLSVHRRVGDKKDSSGWAPAVFRDPCTCGKDKCPGAGGHRIDENVLELHALVFDLDKRRNPAYPGKRADGTPEPSGLPLDEATANACLKRLEVLKLRRVVHTTYSHNPSAGTWSLRIVIALSRPVSARQWERFWRAAVSQIDIHVEPSCFNPARFWFEPSAPLQAEPWSRSYDGELLDVDAVLDVAPAPPQPKPRPSKRQTADRFDIYRFMAEAYPGARADFSQGITRWEIECPWEHEHSSSSPRDTMVSFSADTGPGFSCLHDHCRDRHWRDFREHHEPGYQQRAAERENDIAKARARKEARASAEAPRTASAAPTEQLDLRHAGYGPGGGYRCTDLGNARRFADMHGDRMGYVFAWDRWLVWDGKRWRRDEGGTAITAAGQVTAAVYQDIARLAASASVAINSGAVTGETALDALGKWASDSSKRARIEAMIALAKAEPEIRKDAALFDRNPWLLNVANGTIDLREGELRPHRQSDAITLISPVEYDPSATAPEWERFLGEMIPDPDIRYWMQCYLGYSITGLVSEQIFAFWVGTGGNGKNVCADAVCAALGDYAMVGAPDLLLEKHGDTHPTELADIEGKRLIVCSEIEPGRSWAEARIKQITGDATIKARRMREDFREFAATGKLVVLANTKPKVRSTDNGLWRRMRLQPWPVTIPPERRDRQLLARLVANELPGILAWLVHGCLAWQRHGLVEPRGIASATADYKREEDVLGMWLDDCCHLDPAAWQATTALYESYTAWCKAEGIERPWTRKSWLARLTERGGIGQARNAAGTVRGISGVKLLAEWERQ